MARSKLPIVLGWAIESEQAGVQDGVVAADQTAVLELLYALDHRRRRQADLIADLGERQPAVVLQQAQDVTVDVVEIEFLIA